MPRLITSIIGNILALFAAQYFVHGFNMQGGLKEYALAGLVLGLLNLIVKPILKAISLPLIMVTLGLFILVINAGLLWSVDWLFSFIAITSWQALAWGTLIVTAVNYAIAHGKD